MITLRLDPQLEQQLVHTAKHLGLSKSELIRQSLLSYMKNMEKKGAWDAGQDLFGKYASGRDDLSTNRKQLIKDKINAKRS